MNLLLLDERDFVGPVVQSGPSESGAARIEGERLAHLRTVLRSKMGDEIEVGLLDGRTGRARIEAIDEQGAVLDVVLDRDPPAPVDIDLVLALPRPPMLRRLLQAVASMGVKRIVLLQTSRVEKSYWQSAVLESSSLQRHLRLGLEQSRDTVMPIVTLERRFRPFAEDALPGMLENRRGLLADLSYDQRCPASVAQPSTLIVGPEGGFVPFELERLEAAGAEGVSLGCRALRVETAVPALLGRLLR